MSTALRILIRTEIDASRAVLETAEFARASGFDETPSCMIATAVSELARNILKYAEHGEIALRRVEREAGHGIEIEARDQGPGIEEPEDALRDHFSSGGTLGLGLPGVRRLMDDFELDSAPGRGTRVRACKWR